MKFPSGQGFHAKARILREGKDFMRRQGFHAKARISREAKISCEGKMQDG